MHTPIKGPDGIRQLFEMTLSAKDKTLRTALSGKPLVYLAGEGFADAYMKKRAEFGIFLRSLRFVSEDVDRPEHKDHNRFNKEARIAPKDAHLDKSMVIWDDHVAMIDPDMVEGVIVKDEKNAQIMKQWFDAVWERSR